MGVTITDASLSTARRRQLCLYAWRQGTGYPGNPSQFGAKKEQASGTGFKASGPSAEVPLNVKVGCLVATQGNGLQGYVKSSPADCSGKNNGGSN
jgi:hypothetical protein